MGMIFHVGKCQVLLLVYKNIINPSVIVCLIKVLISGGIDSTKVSYDGDKPYLVA